jgi:hypothetical protein
MGIRVRSTRRAARFSRKQTMQLPPRDPGPPLAPLEYYTPGPPPRMRSAGAWGMALALGWAPFLCGIVSRQAVARSGVPEIIQSHITGGWLLMGAGIAVSVACFLAFLRRTHVAGMIASAGILVLQSSVLACIAFAK